MRNRRLGLLNRADGIIAAFAAVLVLVTSLLDPRVSVGLAFLALAGLAIYLFFKDRGKVPGANMRAARKRNRAVTASTKQNGEKR